MKKTLISLAMFATVNVNAQQALFEVKSFNSPIALKIHQKSQVVLSSTQFSVTQKTLTLSIPIDGKQVEFSKQTASISNSGNIVWLGETQKGGRATLIQAGSGVTGTVKLENRLFKIRPIENNNHSITEIDEINAPKEHHEGFNGSVKNSIQELSANSLLNPVQNTIATVASADIKLLVVYTAAAKSKVADINSLIDLAVVETNTGYANSAINAQVSVVHKAQVTYTEASNSSTDLTRLAATNDGYMDEVHTLRDQYGADVVVLVNDVNGYCGQADAIGANASSAFVIVDYDCATGYYSFGHEIGHLQGARHNPENDPTTTPYDYGHGYQDPQSRWRTVMAYNCTSGCTRINYWSNPDKSYAGDVMGTNSDSNNARVLNLTSNAMANFRSGPVTPPEVIVLENNQNIVVSADKGSEKFYSFNVPSGASNISVSTSGGTGDADLYVKLGEKASSSIYDCRSRENDNTEHCALTQSGEYSIMVSAYAAYSNMNLIGSYTLGGSTLPITVTKTDLSGEKDVWQFFSVDVPVDAKNISVTLSGGTGDADMYLRKGSKPTASLYDCRPWKNGNSEACNETITNADTWHVGLKGYAAYTGVKLEIIVK